ncbi:MAG TPA: preprotein translocase subunit YajC [Gaiellaceae bacterium]|jgi:preprotein translocase subunit YajC
MEPLIFLAAMAVLFWFLLIRPQRRRQSDHQAMISTLSTGDEIVTAGGIFGTVRTIADNHVVLEIAPGTEIRVAKEAVANIVPKAEESPPVAEEHG